VYESKEKNKIFFSHETYTRGFILYLVVLKLGINLKIIVIDLIIVN